MRKIYITVAFTGFLLSGCASVVTGQNQSLAVDSSPSGAQCTLTNDKGTWFVNQTPGTVTVTRAYSDMSVKCSKGNKSGLTNVSSTTKAMAFGNVLAGGIIGAAVDMSTGAAYDYPSPIMVQLQ